MKWILEMNSNPFESKWQGPKRQKLTVTLFKIWVKLELICMGYVVEVSWVQESGGEGSTNQTCIIVLIEKNHDFSMKPNYKVQWYSKPLKSSNSFDHAI